MPEPELIGSPVTVIAASGTSLTFTKPIGLTNGDYLIAVCRSQNASATTDFACTGFTRAPGPAWVSASGGARVQGFYYKKITDAANEPATYVFSLTGVSNRNIGMLLVVRGVDLTTPFYGPMGTAGVYGGDGITNGKRVTGYTTGFTNPALILFAGGAEFTSPNDHTPVTSPAGMTQIDLLTTSTNLGSSRTSMWVGKLINTTGTVFNEDMTWTAASGAHAGGLAIQGLPAAPAAFRRHVLSLPKVRRWNGTAWSPPPGVATVFRLHVGTNPINRWQGAPAAWVRKWTPP